MKVHFYGKLSAALGSEIDLEVEYPCTVAGLRIQLNRTHPGLAEMLVDRRVRAVVGDQVVPDGHQLRPGDKLEFLAPVSGG